MSKVKVEDLSVLQDMDSDEAKDTKGGLNIGIGELQEGAVKDDDSKAKLDDIKGESSDGVDGEPAI